jgi:amidase
VEKSCRTKRLVDPHQRGAREERHRGTAAPGSRLLLMAMACVLAIGATPTSAQVLDLETLDGPTAIQMMEDGRLTSVRLTKAYLDRIEALNKRGPGLNAVTQLNAEALAEAAAMDKERAQGIVRGPAHGLPVLLKDLIDVKGMYTSNGNYSLRNSFPEDDSGIVKKLRASGVVILGKLGLSEYANSFGNQPSGFSNLTGQVIHALDADQNPSGSSSGSGTAGAAALSMLTVGTETSGSIISPSTAQSLVGIRPTVGLVPAYGIGPISSSQDTAGPMDRTVTMAAMHLQSMAGRDPKNEAGYAEVFGPSWEQSVTRAPEVVPDYMSALDLNFVNGKRIGYNISFDPGSTGEIAFNLAFDALVAAGAILVERPQIAVGDVPPLPSGYQQHNAINLYYKNLGPLAPIQSLLEEIADNQANEHEALKFGNNSHLNSSMAEVAVGGPNQLAYQAAMPIRRAAQWSAINRMMNNDTPEDPTDDFIAILGGVPSGAAAGTPQITIPMGYSAANRRAFGINIHGNQLSERDLIGVAYVIEQGTKLRQPASALNPSMYRCAKTVPLPPFHERGDCNPTYKSLEVRVKNAPELDFALELESVQSLQARLTAGTLTSRELVNAYLARIAMTNAEGPALQAVRVVAPEKALGRAKRLDTMRARGKVLGPLHGIPVLLSDVIDVRGVATTGGSIALQNALAKKDASLVDALEAAGAIILGKTNLTELHGIFDSDLPEGYSSLGGQVLLPSDTDKTTAGSSAGAAAATAAGLAALTIGLETSLDSAQIIAPAGVAGVVGLKPTVGLVSRAGVLPAAKSQDSPGPITRTVYDAAVALTAIAGEDPADDATSGAPEAPDYLTGLVPTALGGKRVAVIDATTTVYPAVVAELAELGATTVVKTIGTPDPNPPSIVPTEFQRDLNAYLATLRIRKDSAKSLAEIIAYNTANPVEGLKYQQEELIAAQAIDLSDPATAAAYEADKAAGKASSQALIDAILNNGTPEDASDDFDVIVVPSGNALVGVADRAGYPVLTVPAGYGTGNAGRNPIGVTFVAGAFAEAKLLAAGFAYEQATLVRLAPSFTNPSMFRCVPGSDFFSPHHCHPGDLLYESPL